MSDQVRLDDCPYGLFWFAGTLGFKSEYATPKVEDGTTVGLQCDAYVVSSGEYFWGGTSDWRSRAGLMVTPIETDDLDARIAELEAALRPFAKNADVWDAYSETQELVEPFNGDPRVSELTVADLRRARAALSTKEDAT